MNTEQTNRPGHLYEVDPTTLQIDTTARVNLDDDNEFAESIRTHGVREPVTAHVGPVGALIVMEGRRRTLTAARVGTPSGTIPVRVVPHPDESDLTTGQPEDLHRSSLREPGSKVAGEQLTLLGMSSAQIVPTAPHPGAAVSRSVTATGAGGIAARDHLDSRDLTLDDAAVLAEFDDDDRALATLIAALDDPRRPSLHHTAQRLRDQRALERAHAELAARLRGDGVRVLETHEHPHPLDAHDLRHLVRADGTAVPEDEWATLPGAAVALVTRWHTTRDGDGELIHEPRWICTDLDAAGLHRPTEVSPRNFTPEERAAATEKRRALVQNNRAWKSATIVRRAWLAAFLTRTRPPAGAEHLICRSILTGDPHLAKAMGQGHPLLRQLLLHDATPVWDGGATICIALADQATTAPRATMRTLAALLTAWEASAGVNTWRHATPWDRTVMTALTRWGYQPSEIETLLLKPPGKGDTAA